MKNWVSNAAQLHSSFAIRHVYNNFVKEQATPVHPQI
jgi:hypothetical protein